ncbi:ribosome small subunit-dependent GTPase A [Ammoniphilus oxalaticus]|uniref:Small ribosomal subunit biogenesis GTPase RsgA n=1 Tax=Ammoniphilus oxalaticus TaxID=66863 RepID=A0A419SJS7_9BACL|nr:ribosome small subunit-dependent GTPase A [Ammoniphilus oxalaticus]RKD24148.1 ribosome small subunit-dependent GTPase A [Ammoniphilus oxalaticus]
MPEGRIIKALSGYYYVLDEEKTWQCRARGVFKKRGISPLVGDWVTYDQGENQEGFIQTVADRKTELVRPPIANVEQAFLVFSLAEPVFNPLLLDRFLVHTEGAGLRSIICLSKVDLLRDGYQAIKETYEQIGYPVLATSKKTGEGIQELKALLRNHISVFSGQSGVGKSSLLNEILPGVNLQIGQVSERLRRGKHTTRHVELIPVEGGFVADTPGFSQLDFFDVDPEQLGYHFIDFKPYIADCKFRGCLHISEPGCAVRAALADGQINQQRYDNYAVFLEEIKEDKRRRY